MQTTRPVTMQTNPHLLPRFGSGGGLVQRGTGETIKRWLITRSNYIDQRAIVQWAGGPVNGIMIGAGAGLTGWNALRAKPEERRKTIIRDTLVLTAAIGGSILAAKRFKPLAEEGELLVEHAKKNLADGTIKLWQEIPALKKTLLQHFDTLNEKHTFKTTELETLYDKIAATKGIGKKRVNEVFETLFDNGEGFTKELQEALKFFGIGGIGVLSGIAGGLVANKINGVKDPEAVPNMVKEGIFQFVANIALCAVGAGAALGLLNSDKLPGKAGQIAKHFTEFVNNSPLKKVYRTGIVMMGLCLGIFGGSHIANYVGQKYVNPLLDKLQGKPPARDHATGKRKLEACDMMLHLDDVPTAMAIAGTAILGPWIIPFFPISGYRAGIGYRNDASAKTARFTNVPYLPKFQAQSRFAYPCGAPVRGFSIPGNNLPGQPAFASYDPQSNQAGIASPWVSRSPGYASGAIRRSATPWQFQPARTT